MSPVTPATDPTAGFHRLDDVALQHLHHFQLEAADTILHGANPGEIPFHQVSKFELSINLKTAKAARAYGTVHLAYHSRQSGGVGYPRFKRSKAWHRLKGRYGSFASFRRRQREARFAPQYQP
jgi:hypothetical protein